MNIEEIKKKLDDSAYWGDISPNEIEKDVTYLLSIIEQQKAEIVELRDREYNEYPRIILDLETRIFKLQDDANTQEGILEQAEKALEQISNLDMGSLSFPHVEIALKALQAIRGN